MRIAITLAVLTALMHMTTACQSSNKNKISSEKMNLMQRGLANSVSFKKMELHQDRDLYEQRIKIDISNECGIGRGGAGAGLVKECRVKLDFLPGGKIVKITPTMANVKDYGAEASFLQLSPDQGYIVVKYKDGNFEKGELITIQNILSDVQIVFHGPKIKEASAEDDKK